MFPSLTDTVALLGIDLVLCAVGLRLLNPGSARSGLPRPWTKWTVAACFALLWVPVGSAGLPLLAYIRGVSSDLSISFDALACASLLLQWRGQPALPVRERSMVFYAVAVAAIFLYPLALGWGNWDAYRPGWGSLWMLLTLLVLTLGCLAKGLRLLPVLTALALLAWTAGLLESDNLWDYLVDPWLAAGSIFYCVKAIAGKLRVRFGLLKP